MNIIRTVRNREITYNGRQFTPKDEYDGTLESKRCLFGIYKNMPDLLYYHCTVEEDARVRADFEAWENDEWDFINVKDGKIRWMFWEAIT